MGETCFYCKELIDIKKDFVRYYEQDHVFWPSVREIKCSLDLSTGF